MNMAQKGKKIMKFFKWGVELFNGLKIGGHSEWAARLFRLGKFVIYLNPVRRYGTQLLYRGGQNYFIHLGRITFHWIGPTFYSPPDPSLRLIYPPWNVKEVNRLYKGQSTLVENGHHFTCSTCFKRLTPEKNGWICSNCSKMPREQYAYHGMITQTISTHVFFPFDFFLRMHQYDSIFYSFGMMWEDVKTEVEIYMARNYPDLLEYIRIQRDLFWIRFYGFDPLGVTFFMNEEPSFLFRSQEESDQAYYKLERKEGKVFGYWVTPEEAKEEFNNIYPDEDFNESVYYFHENLNL